MLFHRNRLLGALCTSDLSSSAINSLHLCFADGLQLVDSTSIDLPKLCAPKKKHSGDLVHLLPVGNRDSLLESVAQNFPGLQSGFWVSRSSSSASCLASQSFWLTLSHFDLKNRRSIIFRTIAFLGPLLDPELKRFLSVQ